MSAINLVFPQKIDTLPVGEMIVIAERFNDPIVKKYLTHLAQVQVEAISFGLRKPGESAESYLERLAAVRGGLEVLMTLLSIETANTAA